MVAVLSHSSLPRSGHEVVMVVNSVTSPLTMVLDSTGHGYFPTQEQPGGRQYRWAGGSRGEAIPTPVIPLAVCSNGITNT